MIDDYITSVIDKCREDKKLRYEVELRLTPEGVQKMIGLREDMEGMCEFVGKALLHFRDLSSLNEN